MNANNTTKTNGHTNGTNGAATHETPAEPKSETKLIASGYTPPVPPTDARTIHVIEGASVEVQAAIKACFKRLCILRGTAISMTGRDGHLGGLDTPTRGLSAEDAVYVALDMIEHIAFIEAHLASCVSDEIDDLVAWSKGHEPDYRFAREYEDSVAPTASPTSREELEVAISFLGKRVGTPAVCAARAFAMEPGYEQHDRLKWQEDLLGIHAEISAVCAKMGEVKQ